MFDVNDQEKTSNTSDKQCHLRKNRSGYCVTTVRIGETIHAGTFPQSPTPSEISFFFFTNPAHSETVREQGWTPVLLDPAEIPFIPTSGPREMPELGWTENDVDNMRAKYVKILSHMIPELASCELVLYVDTKIQLSNDIVYGAITKMENIGRSRPSGLCAVLAQHFRTPEKSFEQEVAASYKQERYTRFRPAIDKQREFHVKANDSFDGLLHAGGLHIFNLSNLDAVQFQKTWWNETVAYSIQDQLSLFFQLEKFQHCFTSWARYTDLAAFGDISYDTLQRNGGAGEWDTYGEGSGYETRRI